MRKTNVAMLRVNLSELLSLVEMGEEIEIHRRNVPIAKISGLKKLQKNQTRIGIGQGTVKIFGDVTGPTFEDDWEMLK